MKNPMLHRAAKESGQAIVLIAALMVVLIASVGLAIDGGGMFLLYRDVQNASDAAALSAAFALCTDGDPVDAGLRSANLNGFDPNNPNIDVRVNYPPTETDNLNYRNNLDMVEIIIEAEKPSYFIQVVYAGPLVISSTTLSQCSGSPATGSVQPSEQFAFQSLAAANECTASTAWNVAGTRFLIEGDIWLPNAAGNTELQSDDPLFIGAEIRANPSNILGDIQIGEPYNPSYDATSTILVEDIRTSEMTDLTINPGYTGTFGENGIEYNVPQPNGGTLEWDWSYFIPGGPLDTANSSNYHDLSSFCSPDNIFNQQYIQNNATFGFYDDPANPSPATFNRFYDIPTSTWRSGIYYAPCNLILDGSMSGNVTFIVEDVIEFNGSGPMAFNTYQAGLPVLVTNYSSTGNRQDC
ncbi:MAG: pilus assembly protein TadG-related protein, partial [Phototrophicaceae bacterium]